MQHFRNFTLLKYFIPRSVSCNSTMIKCNKVEDEDEYVIKVHIYIQEVINVSKHFLF